MDRDTAVPDALTQLRTEHSHLSSLLGELVREANAGRARGLFRTLYDELRAHGSAEQAVFYAVLAGNEAAADVVRRALAAHEHIDELADELMAAPPSQPAWRETLRALQRAVAEHAAEEERELFTIARRELGGDALRAMGAQLVAAAARWREAECAGEHARQVGEPMAATARDG
jgi:hypothetical protein